MGTFKLLLVDDEPHVTLVLSRKLERAGFDVQIARDGEEGFTKAQSFLPDMIVSDLQMPRADGMTLAVNLAGCEATKEIPILLLSGRGFLLDDEVRANTNIVRVLEKPFSAKDIIANVHEILDAPESAQPMGRAA